MACTCPPLVAARTPNGAPPARMAWPSQQQCSCGAASRGGPHAAVTVIACCLSSVDEATTRFPLTAVCLNIPSCHRPPTAVELLRSFAYARGWVAASGLPDETRAGRRILKDYVDGKILYCKAPPGAGPDVLALAAAAGRRQRAPGAAAAAGAPAPPAQQQQQQVEDGEHGDGAGQQGAAAADAAQAEGAAASGSTAGTGEGPDPQGGSGVVDLDEDDLLLMDDLDIGGRKAKVQRPAYKVRGAAGRAGCYAAEERVGLEGVWGLERERICELDVELGLAALLGWANVLLSLGLR